jgi:TolA-binding protein
MIQELQQIRIASLQESIDINFSDGAQMLTRRIPLPDSILSVQRAAVSDALYWTALTQLSMNDYGTAVQTLRNYRRQYPNSSLQFASQLNEAEALAELGNLASAAEVLAGANIPENPEQVRAAWLHSMLSAAAAAPNP